MKFKRIFFILLLVIGCGVWIYNATLILPERSAKGKKKNIANSVQAVFHYKADFPDPFYCKQFMPPIVKAGTGSGVKKVVKEENVVLPPCKIGGIVFNASNPMAIFVYNGKSQLVKQGDMIDSIAISKISSDKVEVMFKGKVFVLTK